MIRHIVIVSGVGHIPSAFLAMKYMKQQARNRVRSETYIIGLSKQGAWVSYNTTQNTKGTIAYMHGIYLQRDNERTRIPTNDCIDPKS